MSNRRATTEEEHQLNAVNIFTGNPFITANSEHTFWMKAPVPTNTEVSVHLACVNSNCGGSWRWKPNLIQIQVRYFIC